MEFAIQSLQELLKNAVLQNWPLSIIKKVFYGDPVLINESSLPAITISPSSSDYVQAGSRYDEKTHNIEIRIVYNMKSFLNSDKNDAEYTELKQIRTIIQQAEQTNNIEETQNYTVCWTIQKNPKLPYVVSWKTYYACELAKVVSVQYWQDTARGFPTYEAIINVSCTAIGDR